MDYSKEELRLWIQSEVTKDFLSIIKLSMDDADNMVHKALEANQLNEAALHNAGMTAYAEVLDIPERMKNDLKEDL